MYVSTDDRAASRLCALAWAGAGEMAERWHFETADVARNPETGAVYIVTNICVARTEQEEAAERADWLAACEIAEDSAPWRGGAPYIGEPYWGHADTWCWIVGEETADT